MALNNAELSVVLEEINVKQVADTVNRAAVLKRILEAGGTGEINGRGVNVFAKVTSNYALKWFGEGGTYPVGGNATRVKMTANYARLAISSQLTRDVLEGADKKAIINVVSESVVDDTITATQELSQQLYGNGSGAKAIVASVASLNVTFRVSVADLTPDNANYGNTYGTYLLKKSGRYNFISGDGASDRGSGGGTQTAAVGTVLVIAATSNVATLGSITSGSVAAFDAVPDDNYTLLDGDMIVNEGSYGIAVNGLDYHIDSGTGTYQNVSRNTYSTLRCYVLNASNSALTVAMLYKIIFQAKFLRGQDVMDENYIILSAPTQVHQYALLADISVAGYNGSSAKTNLNVMPDAKKLDYGFTMFEFAGLKWVEDPHAPAHQIFIILPSKFKIHEFKPLAAVPLGGDSGFAPVPAFTSAGVGSYTDNAVYTMTWKGQLVTNDPAKAGLKITNLATSGLALPTSGFSLT
jgi:hypothetical protein